MPSVETLSTIVSTKGQVILPKSVREHLRWDVGTRLVVEQTDEGVLLKRMPAFAATRPEDVFAKLAFDGPAKSLAEMDAGVMAEAMRRHAGA